MHRHVLDAVEEHDRMQIIADNRADALAKLGADMHDDDVDDGVRCACNERRYTDVLIYMTRCLAHSLEQGLHQEI